VYMESDKGGFISTFYTRVLDFLSKNCVANNIMLYQTLSTFSCELTN
jgi:hypothetical protein